MFLLIAAAAAPAEPAGAGASARIVRGERISLATDTAAQQTAADRQRSEIVRIDGAGDGRVLLRLVEFQ